VPALLDRPVHYNYVITLYLLFCPVIHCDDLPLPPRHWNGLKRHAHGKQFEAAAVVEFNNCWKKCTFAKPDITATRTDAVPLMWVFTYKFDEDGYLIKYKAWLVVRGDCNEVSYSLVPIMS
jgi:hypothetical protein